MQDFITWEGALEQRSREEEEDTTKAGLGNQRARMLSTHKQEAMSNEHLRTNKGGSGIYRHFPATFLLN
jgi:hypothetical protein